MHHCDGSLRTVTQTNTKPSSMMQAMTASTTTALKVLYSDKLLSESSTRSALSSSTRGMVRKYSCPPNAVHARPRDVHRSRLQIRQAHTWCPA